MSRITRALLALALLALAAPEGAAAAPILNPMGTFDVPMYVTSPPGDPSRLFVVERGGTIRVVRDGTTLATPVLDISADVNTSGERGLLSMAFPPDFATSGLFYVYFTAEPDGQLQVREYRRSAANPDVADPTSGRRVWFANHAASNHNGGTIAFGRDGNLWIATGDGAGQAGMENAQNPSSLLGKVLRIDPRGSGPDNYTVPPGGPYGNGVWAVGLRNPFRFSFDRVTGDLVIGDVGDSQHEEIDFVRWPDLGRGANYGWPCREGFADGPGSCPAPPFTDPVYDLPRPAYTALTGGVVVRDPGLPSLVGRYLYADYYEGVIRSLALGLPRATDDRPTGIPSVSNLAAFGEDGCGHVYVVSNNGGVYRLQEGALSQCAGAPPAPVPGGSPFPDRTSPRVRIRVARKGRVGRRATPRIQLTATETCRVTIRARLAGTTLKRVRTPLRGGRRTIVRLRPKAKAVKRIHRALRRHKRVTLVVSVTAVDAAGNVGRVQRRLKVRRG
jgi:glucose/arabinose dehydrogenase